ncbi:MAG TPA: (d)CMP kinase [Alphaproteobacteria bacterium]|nr:(d)CMP kinase [Alphaproteobacteria bacterium]
MIVAIDGPAASGKGTLARRLAGHFGLGHLDTGALYRAAGWRVIEAGGDPADPAAAVHAAASVRPEDTALPDLRSDAVAQAASIVAAIPEVRIRLLDFQRRFAGTPPGAVLDGRDIGTVVCPKADAKLFVTASVEARARRRFNELRGKGENVIYDAVLQDMKQRDARDSGRAVSPLKPAEDAFFLDTSDLDADQAFAAALDFIAEKTGRR